MEPAHKTLTLTVKPNGLPKKIKVVSVYRECLKNHAASLGGHALDGCGEFMASPTSNPSDPTSLTCAACGCHRNFHRRLHRHRPISERQPNSNDDDNEEEKDGQDEDEMDDDDEEKVDNSSAPHMLLALSAGGISPKPQAQPMQIHPVSVAEESRQFQMKFGSGQENGSDRAVPNSRKRFRTKFSPQQKERMHELSERLGWRMHKRDEVLVEERCREIGIDKGVFKVWMHNNKHNFVQSSFRSSTTTVTIPVTTATIENGNDNGNGNGMTVKVNGSGSDASKHNEIEN